MHVMSGVISLKDNATATLRAVRKEQSAFKREVDNTKKSLTKTWDKTYKARLDATAASKKAKQLSKQYAPLRKKIATAVAVKDIATSKIKAVGSRLKSIGKTVASPVVKLKDKASFALKSLSGKLKSIGKAVAIPIAAGGAAAVAGVGATVKSGMELEQQQVSMEHFVGATNKGMSQDQVKATTDKYIAALRDNANKTPFETGEVIQAGSRAIAIASGNTKEAMSLVTLAEDMAAASGGTKSVSDAIEALADAKLGEMERLKEFGFKVSKEQFDSKGFGGVAADLQNFYGGAANKLATTGAGLLSTIKGKLKSFVADTGLKMVDKLKPAFEGVITIIDKCGPAIEVIGGVIADKLGRGIQWLSSALPGLTSKLGGLSSIGAGLSGMMAPLKTFGGSVMSTLGTVASSVMPAVSSIIGTVQQVLPSVLPILSSVISTVGTVVGQTAPIIASAISAFGTVITTIAPVVKTIFDGIGSKVSSVIGIISDNMGWITNVISTAAPVIKDVLSTAWSVISPIMDACINVFRVLLGVVKKVFPTIQKVIEKVWTVIKPIVSGIGTVIGGVSKGVGWIADKLGVGSGDKTGNNATGTQSWRGGMTWVGEHGPELMALPKGTRILSNPQSKRQVRRRDDDKPQPQGGKGGVIIHINIPKLADQIIVREEADIDRIGEAVTKRVVLAVRNSIA